MNIQLPVLRWIILAVLLIATLMVRAQNDDEGTLTIPALDLRAEIAFAPFGQGTWDVSHLRMNVARLEALPWFSTDLNMVLVGHSLDTSGRPDIFYHLKKLQVGDVIYVTTGGKHYLYRVVEVTNVEQTDLSIIYPRNGADLTLFTCDADSFIGNAYQRREVVIARHVRPLKFGITYTQQNVIVEQSITAENDANDDIIAPVETSKSDIESMLRDSQK